MKTRMKSFKLFGFITILFASTTLQAQQIDFTIASDAPHHLEKSWTVNRGDVIRFHINLKKGAAFRAVLHSHGACYTDGDLGNMTIRNSEFCVGTWDLYGNASGSESLYWVKIDAEAPKTLSLTFDW